jgi:mannose-1-phosphate guanylyltransferase
VTEPSNKGDPIRPVVLCGGSGTRLWPRSRADKPKPFLPLVGDSTLFAATLGRCAGDDRFAPPLVVAGARHLRHVEEQVPGDCGGAEVIVEPAARNTAAAIALAAARLAPETVMLICPSDHHIGNAAAFRAAALSAAALASEGWLVAFGIKPHGPETGFGYIKRGEALGSAGYRIDRFVEKPDRAHAEAMLGEGGYYWNGGIFAFAAGTYLEELRQFRPAIADAAAAAVEQGRRDGQRFHPDADRFAAVPSESVDYAVMENTRRAAVVPVEMDWSDIGNWQALHQALDRDEHGNAVQGRAELVACRNVLVSSDGPRVSVIGASNLVVVVDGDEVLVTTADGAQGVGKLTGAAQQ